MQIGPTLNPNRPVPVFPDYKAPASSGNPPGVTGPEKPLEKTMGAADLLPGQGPSFEVTGRFGFCTQCGMEHPLSQEFNPAFSPESIRAPENEAPADGQYPGTNSQPIDKNDVVQEDRDRGFGENTDEERQQIDKLKRRDREVRAHEQAHVAAGGKYVRGGIQYEYETGPDGRRYAVGGEVSIDTSPVSGDPEATIRKAQTVRRAALAPAQPSPQDRRAATVASRMEMKARRELMARKMEHEDSAGMPAPGAGSDFEQSRESGEALGPEGVGQAGGPENAGKQGIIAEGGYLRKADAGQPPAVTLDYQRKVQTPRLVDLYG